MSDFTNFIATELPKRPFTQEDGQPGQVPVRSENAGHGRELVWRDFPLGLLPQQLRIIVPEAGQQVFTLPTSPVNAVVIFSLNGINLHSYTIIGPVITLSDMLLEGDDVLITWNLLQ